MSKERGSCVLAQNVEMKEKSSQNGGFLNGTHPQEKQKNII